MNKRLVESRNETLRFINQDFPIDLETNWVAHLLRPQKPVKHNSRVSSCIDKSIEMDMNNYLTQQLSKVDFLEDKRKINFGMRVFSSCRKLIKESFHFCHDKPSEGQK